MKTPVPIFIADDHQLVRKGFRSLLEELDWIEVAGEASNGKEVLAFLRSRAFTGIVLLDCEMPEMDGLQTLEVIRREFFGVKTIMLTMLQDKSLIQKAVDLGVNGFLFQKCFFGRTGNCPPRSSGRRPLFCQRRSADLVEAVSCAWTGTPGSPQRTRSRGVEAGCSGAIQYGNRKIAFYKPSHGGYPPE
ncbi:MAG: response regulator [Haliscomenobacter sp.]|nr:response regulator [Haliscomenobacter sp.]